MKIKMHFEKKFTAIVEQKNYIELLKIYNRKSIASQIGDVFGLKRDELPQFVARLSSMEVYRKSLQKAILRYLPEEFIGIIEKEEDEK